MWFCLEQGADRLQMVQLMPLPSPSSLALFKSRLVIPFWYRLTQVVLEKRPLNGCSTCSSVFAMWKILSLSLSICIACVGTWVVVFHNFSHLTDGDILCSKYLVTVLCMFDSHLASIFREPMIYRSGCQRLASHQTTSTTWSDRSVVTPCSKCGWMMSIYHRRHRHAQVTATQSLTSGRMHLSHRLTLPLFTRALKRQPHNC